jgi:membrane protein DedA with SNARE-associated domain
VDFLLRYGLAAVFVALLATAFGSPIPEDACLVAGGLLAHHRPEVLPWAYLVGWLGVMLADTVPWILGRRVGLHPHGFLTRLIGRRRSRRILRFYERFGVWTIAICRNFPGMRFPAFFFAGATGTPLTRFWLVDGGTAVLSVGVWVTLGWRFGALITRALAWMDRLREVGAVLAATLVAWLAWDLVRRWRRQRAQVLAGEEITEDVTGTWPGA